MGREIKFRIWDSKKKEWLGASNKNSLQWYGFGLVGECMTVQAPSQWALDEGMIVEQSTGLKDIRDCEVYEGDIIQCGDWTYYVVIYQDGQFVCKGSRCLLKTILREDMGKVVGNIHENPELLDKLEEK